MKTVYAALTTLTFVRLACSGGQPTKVPIAPEQEWNQEGMLASGTVHYDLGDVKLSVDVPIAWKVVNQTATHLMMQSDENEAISMAIMSREKSSLEEVCPVFWNKLDPSYAPSSDEQVVAAKNVTGKKREYQGDVPTMGGPVQMLFYCLQSGANYVKLDVVAHKEIYFQKPGLYGTILDRFRFSIK